MLEKLLVCHNIVDNMYMCVRSRELFPEQYLLMLKSRGWRTHLIILRGCHWVIDFLLDVGHRPVIPNHTFRSIRHHTDL